jgi:hypothetical protein
VIEEISAGAARETCAALLRAGTALAERPAADVVAVLAAAASRWRDPVDPARQEGERALAAHHGVPRAAIARVLDAGFETWTAEALLGRVRLDLGDERALDDFVAVGSGRRMAVGPRLAVVIASRGVPTTPVGDAIDLLSVKASVWLKPAAGADDLAFRFARTVRELDPGIGAAIEVSSWPRESSVGAQVFESAEIVVATGRDETLAELGGVVGAGVRLVVHGPRLSAAIVTREALAADPDACVAALADDVAFAGQAGCLSPVVAWIEGPPGERLVESVHRACEERWPAPARTANEPAQRAAWSEWSSLARIEQAAGVAGAPVGGAESGWSVQWRDHAEPPAPPPAPRILVLAPVGDVEEAVRLCAAARGIVAAIGVAGPAPRVASLARSLARAGVERIAPLGRMQRPPADWRRDGRSPIADLVRWVDFDA